jgi:DNA-binding LacI/PurR family transcriptional regulator
VILHSVDSGVEIAEVLAGLSNRRVDGLVLFAPYHTALHEGLARAGVPVVNAANEAQDVPSVVVDERDGMRQVMEHLAGLGHRHLIYRDWIDQSSGIIARRAGAFDWAAHFGINLEPGRTMAHDFEAGLTDPEHDAIARGATGIVCWEDTSASATCDALEAAGVSLAVTGFNGLRAAVRPRWNLTTVRCPWREVGISAVRQLHTLVLGGQPAPLEVLPVALQVGETSTLGLAGPLHPTKDSI